MELDLQNLYINKADLKNIVNISDRDLSAYHKLKAPRSALLLQILLHAEQILLLGWGLIPLSYLAKWKWLRKRQTYLLEEVDRYNQIIKTLEINEQLVAAGNQDLSLGDKEKFIQVLMTTRNNLISALKTEKILRNNRAVISRNREFLASNLTALQVLQTTEEAREYTNLLRDALHTAQEVEEELKKLEG
ncbi:MAG: hypothetical protein AAF378_01920 [Cyanobacteria bacterium P01_A01_bin.84]